MFQEVPAYKNDIPEFDPVFAEHYWHVIGAWRCANPHGVMIGDVEMILDTENLVMLSPPVCAHCGLVYTPQLARKRCTNEA